MQSAVSGPHDNPHGACTGGSCARAAHGGYNFVWPRMMRGGRRAEDARRETATRQGSVAGYGRTRMPC